MFSKFFYVVLAAMMSVPAAFADETQNNNEAVVEEFTPDELQTLDEVEAGDEMLDPQQRWGGGYRIWRCQAYSPRKAVRYWGNASYDRRDARQSALRRCERNSYTRCYIAGCQRARYGRPGWPGRY